MALFTLDPFDSWPTMSRPWEDKSWKGETGRVDDLVRKYADLWGLTGESTLAYLCGQPSMIENTQGILKCRGWQLRIASRQRRFSFPAKSQPLLESQGVIFSEKFKTVQSHPTANS
jgi:NAD(P)H-flavin reductase